MAMVYFMGRNAKSALKGGGKIGGVAVATGVSGLLHAVAALQITIRLRQAALAKMIKHRVAVTGAKFLA